jgi:hypothetical protein
MAKVKRGPGKQVLDQADIPMQAGNLRAAARAENSPPAMGKDLPKKGKGPKRGKAHAGSMMGY